MLSARPRSRRWPSGTIDVLRLFTARRERSADRDSGAVRRTSALEDGGSVWVVLGRKRYGAIPAGPCRRCSRSHSSARARSGERLDSRDQHSVSVRSWSSSTSSTSDGSGDATGSTGALRSVVVRPPGSGASRDPDPHPHHSEPRAAITPYRPQGPFPDEMAKAREVRPEPYTSLCLARIRTGMPCGAAPSRQCVYQFHHQGRVQKGRIGPQGGQPDAALRAALH